MQNSLDSTSPDLTLTNITYHNSTASQELIEVEAATDFKMSSLERAMFEKFGVRVGRGSTVVKVWCSMVRCEARRCGARLGEAKRGEAGWDEAM